MSSNTKILIVDDEVMIRRVLVRILGDLADEVVCVEDGRQALQVLDRQQFDVVLSDVSMPNVSGIELLTAIREHDPELPVIVFTGRPTLESAISAVNLRATAYLQKPLEAVTLQEEVNKALHLGRLARVRREASTLGESTATTGARSDDLAERLQSALQGLFMAYQPIVDWSQRRVYGYEAVVCTGEQGAPAPGMLIDAGERPDRVEDFGRTIRSVVGQPVVEHAFQGALFVSLHPRDLLDPDLYADDVPLAGLASQVVFEITERANLDGIADLESRVTKLRELGYRIAVDDIGAGYSGLNSFAFLRPELVKLDLSLVRNVDKEPLKQRLVRMLCDLSRELGIKAVAEGVDTAEERNTLHELGCELLQGQLFSRPGPPFPQPAFAD